VDETTRECMMALEKRAADFRQEARFCTGLISALGQGYIKAVKVNNDYELQVTDEGRAEVAALAGLNLGLNLAGLKC